MSVDRKTPRFNLGVVIQETNLNPDTLRAWERRYGFPKPQRTEGGHRLYSQQDIDSIKWLSARLAEGMRIGKAIDLWQSTDDPLQLISAAATPLVERNSENPFTELRQRWVACCLNFDEAGAEQVMVRSFALYPTEAVCLRVLQSGLAELGELWCRHEATVQQEHFASALAMRRLDTLFANVPTSTQQATILLGCPVGETHIFSTLLISVMLRHRGWNVIYLGADVPLDRLEQTLGQVQASLVVMPAMQLSSAATLLETANYLQKSQIPLGFGGRVFVQLPALRDCFPGYYLGDTLEEAAVTIERILQYPVLAQSGKPIMEEARLGHIKFSRLQTRIEAQIIEQLYQKDLVAPFSLEFTHTLMADIRAALCLGNMDFVIAKFEKILELGVMHGLTENWLSSLVGICHSTIAQQKDCDLKILEEFFERLPEMRQDLFKLKEGI